MFDAAAKPHESQKQRSAVIRLGSISLDVNAHLQWAASPQSLEQCLADIRSWAQPALQQGRLWARGRTLARRPQKLRKGDRKRLVEGSCIPVVCSTVPPGAGQGYLSVESQCRAACCPARSAEGRTPCSGTETARATRGECMVGISTFALHSYDTAMQSGIEHRPLSP